MSGTNLAEILSTTDIARLFVIVVFFVIVLMFIQWVIERVAPSDKSRKKLG